jgi:phenylpyruvate tautomerase PptA (4-oxalocrotonate tautomerase family)
MPLLQIKGVDGYLSMERKQEMISEVTDALESIAAARTLHHHYRSKDHEI